ncbi:MAG: hypothetical protein CMB95_03770 [Flavobacteriaceae bacterium]|nr:hypothetical protein [Flavobacteriaceae bacterium]
MTGKVIFKGVVAKQSKKHTVISFPANAVDIFKVAKIERAGRNDQGDLFGFQRPQVSNHILEIRDYLKKDDAVLPNSVVLAFVDGVSVKSIEGPFCEIRVDLKDEKPGFVVDGQQRLTALEPLTERDFEVFVSAIICEDEEELRRQFILINNTKPLPKELIYELLPSVDGLPQRLSSRSLAAHLTTKINYFKNGDAQNFPFFGEIRQHTNPTGTISSTAVQKVIMNSRSHGALREFANSDDFEEKAIVLINDFFGALVDLFPEAWFGQTPRTSRMKHSAGITALGFVMEIAYAVHGAKTKDQFIEVLSILKEKDVCAWTGGTWYFDEMDIRIWDKVQNTQPDLRVLADHLVRVVKDQKADKVHRIKRSMSRGPVQSEFEE